MLWSRKLSKRSRMSSVKTMSLSTLIPPYRWVSRATHLTLVLGWSYFIATQMVVSAQFPMSKTLTPSQRRYSQIQKESLAVVFGLKKFHQFLYGKKFILVTDHKLLLALFNPSSRTPALAANRLAQWAVMLSQYDYVIEYCRSTDYGNADALSRLPAGGIPSLTRKRRRSGQWFFLYVW